MANDKNGSKDSMKKKMAKSAKKDILKGAIAKAMSC